MSAYCVGLTGGVASGKSAAADAFAARGVAVVDADRIAAELTAPGGAALPDLRARFGEWAFADDGGLNRAEVRARVFADDELRRRLEEVLHPRIRRRLLQGLAAATSPYAVGVVPLLFERPGWREFFQRVVVVDCAAETQRARLRQRDGVDDAAAIMAAQLPAAARLRDADDVINNDGDMDALTAAVARLHETYLAAAAERAAPAAAGQRTEQTTEQL